MWGTTSNTSIIHERYMAVTGNLQQQYIHDTSLIHWQYISNTSFMYLAGTFHCLLGPVWPPTADQCVRPGAWSAGAPCGCLPRGGFCWTAPNRACWNIHALQAKKHVWCCHAMAVPTLQEPDSDPWAADSQNRRWPRMCETSWDA